MLSNKMETLILNDDLRKRLQANAIKSMDKFNPHRYAIKWETLLKKVTKIK